MFKENISIFLAVYKAKKDNTDTIIHVLMLPYHQNNLMGQTGMLFRGKAQSIDYRSSPLFEKKKKQRTPAIISLV